MSDNCPSFTEEELQVLVYFHRTGPYHFSVWMWMLGHNINHAMYSSLIGKTPSVFGLVGAGLYAINTDNYPELKTIFDALDLL